MVMALLPPSTTAMLPSTVIAVLVTSIILATFASALGRCQAVLDEVVEHGGIRSRVVVLEVETMSGLANCEAVSKTLYHWIYAWTY